jgi:thermitase
MEARRMSKKRTSFLVFAIAALTLVAAPSAFAKKTPPRQPAGASNLFGQSVVPGEVIVRFKAGASAADRRAARSQARATFKESLLLSRTQVVRVRAGSEKAAARRLASLSSVELAEPNGVVHATATPNDTRFRELWGLNNTGQAVNGVAGLADADIDAPEAWNMGRGLGAGVRVADIDSGVAAAHPDLTANMFINPGESGGGKETNGVDDDANGRIDDFRGWDFVNNDNNPNDDNEHGTHVAGTIAARSNNALGVSGTAGFVPLLGVGQWLGPKIVAIKVLNAAGSGSFAGIINGVTYANTIGAKVANMSLGGAGTSAALDTAIRNEPGTLYVVAAGNDGVNNDTSPHTPCVPASLPDPPNKICVAATNSSDQLASFSNFGATHVDLAAPGVTILSSVPQRVIFSDNFETPIAGRWTTTDAGQTPAAPRWGTSTAFSTSPTHSLTDSPAGNYVNSMDIWARNTTGIDLTGGTNCSLHAQAKIDTESGFDFFTIEASRTPTVAASWVNMFTFSGAGEGSIATNIPAAFNNQAGVFVRFRQRSDSSVVHDGSYVDDVAVKCFSPPFNTTNYAFFNGTSMATPHVAGAATFLATKFPTASVAVIKDKIMRSVDKKTVLTGKMVTGGRLNLYKAAAESTAAVASGILRWTAPAGQKNNVGVTRFTDTDGILKYKITDPWSTSTTAQQSGSRVIAGAGCARVNDNTVKCPVAGITRIILTGNDLDDSFNASTILIPLTIDGGAGLDNLIGGAAGDTLIGGTGADRFTGGAGSDAISARNEDVDTLFNCGESTGDTDRVTADLSPDDPVTASPTNCEVVSKA